MTPSRRDFLLLFAGALFRASDPQKVDMLVRSARPEDLEMPLSGFADYITPIPRFFVRNHVYVPTVSLDDWRLRIEGEVARPLSLTMEDLKKLPSIELVSVVECAGNGRAFYDPPVPGVQWGAGAVGNGRWRGVRLGDLLKQAGMKASAREVLFNGADVPLRSMPDFERSIPVKKALDANTLLAYEMNGQTLPVQHGFPLRAVVPGWAGDCWIKWLTSVRALSEEHDGFWMKTAYRHPGRGVAPGTAVPPDQMRSVTSLRVKSVITDPNDGSQVVGTRPITIRGVAWSGDSGPVMAVEVSVDSGRTWRQAALRQNQQTRFGWRQWEFNWRPSSESSYTILARARDRVGNIQPLDQEWNPSGYSWNVVPRIRVDVVREISAGRPPAQTTNATLAQPDTFKSTCLVCHDADIVRQQRLTRGQWEREIQKMIDWGARVADRDRDAILDYLAGSYGP